MLVFAVLPWVLLWEGLEKPPAVGTHELLVEINRTHMWLFFALFRNPLLWVSRLCWEVVWSDWEPSASGIVWAGAGALCRGYYGASSPLPNPFPGSVEKIEQRPKLAQTKLCSHTGGNSRAVLWGQWIETTTSQHSSLVFVRKTVAI